LAETGEAKFVVIVGVVADALTTVACAALLNLNGRATSHPLSASVGIGLEDKLFVFVEGPKAEVVVVAIIELQLRADGRRTNTETPVGIASDLITHVVGADSTLVAETPLLVLTTVAGVGPYLKE